MKHLIEHMASCLLYGTSVDSNSVSSSLFDTRFKHLSEPNHTTQSIGQLLFTMEDIFLVTTIYECVHVNVVRSRYYV